METTILSLLWFLIFISSFLWLGIGAIISILIQKAWYDEKIINEANFFIRICWAVFWPVIILFYFFLGLRKQE